MSDKISGLPERRRATCADCGGIRNCDVLGYHKVDGSDEHTWWATEYYVLRCRGCDSTFFQKVDTHSEDTEPDFDDQGEAYFTPVERETYYPALAHRPRPEWFKETGKYISAMGPLDMSLTELYAAIDANLHMLSGIGIRTVFDIASEQLDVATHLPFAEKIAILVARQFVEEEDRDAITVLVDAGSAAAHRGFRPTERQLNHLMDVLEHFLDQAFVRPQKRGRMNFEMRNLGPSVAKKPRPRKAKNKNTSPPASDVSE
ncbi:DUF4145 domain-containing protein [Pseudoroseomonas globiformis]|uniref:DUF4145 domain-containing protein n=1 Tax=Teichococcus globiformis TaxID=2307229 RepID=A0ABV7FXE7_9PROT